MMDPLAIMIVVLIAILAVMLIGISALAFAHAIDRCFVNVRDEIGTIVDRSHSSAWTQTLLIPIGGVMHPQFIFHPESWSVKVQLADGRKRYTSVSRQVWFQKKVGDEVAVRVKYGRLTKAPYLISVA